MGKEISGRWGQRVYQILAGKGTLGFKIRDLSLREPLVRPSEHLLKQPPRKCGSVQQAARLCRPGLGDSMWVGSGCCLEDQNPSGLELEGPCRTSPATCRNRGAGPRGQVRRQPSLSPAESSAHLPCPTYCLPLGALQNSFFRTSAKCLKTVL